VRAVTPAGWKGSLGFRRLEINLADVPRTRYDVSWTRFELVEAAGVEPASEKVYREKTTCVSDSVFFDRSIRTGKREAA